MSTRTSSVRIVEVGPRDGLQNISSTIPSHIKIELIRRLHESGLQTVELTSAVSPKAIPQLADNKTVLSSNVVQSLLTRQRQQNGENELRLPVLVPNVKGLQLAMQHGVSEVAIFVSASEGFSRANINCSVQEGLERAKAVATVAREKGIAVRGYVSCIFSCPYDGPTPQSAVLKCVQQLLEMGCYEVSLGDTLGVGVAEQVESLLNFLFSHQIPPEKLAGHFHDTYGQAVSNVWTAYKCGLRVFDSSVAGLGGCPYAPGAKGNAASEDLVYLFEQAGVSTGVDLGKLVETGTWISQTISQKNESRAGAAIATKTNLNKSPKQSLSWKPVSDSEGLLIHRSGPNIRLTLNRPKNGNALTEAMIHQLTSYFKSATHDNTTTRIAICASGKFFCTGMDLSKSTPVAQDDNGEASLAQFDRLTNLFEAIESAPQVTIACINGPAFGGGVGLAFACDVRLAVATATVTLSEAKLGLCPATISKYVVRELGFAFAREAMLSARSIQADELQRLGVVARVVNSREDLSHCLDGYLTELKACAPRASTLCKKIVRLGWEDAGGRSQAEGIRQVFAEMMRADAEGSVGVKEFQAGRKKIDWDAYVYRKTTAKL